MQSRAELPDEPPRALAERLARPAEVERQEGAEPRHDLEDDQVVIEPTLGIRARQRLARCEVAHRREEQHHRYSIR